MRDAPVIADTEPITPGAFQEVVRESGRPKPRPDWRIQAFVDGFFGDGASPFLDNARPGHPARDLLQHTQHENPRASKRRLAVANPWIDNNVTAHGCLSHDCHEDGVSFEPSTEPVGELAHETRYA
jgi:hypothetical protein